MVVHRVQGTAEGKVGGDGAESQPSPAQDLNGDRHRASGYVSQIPMGYIKRVKR